MPDIKTRDSLKTIKTFQRAGAKVKDSSAEAKRRIEETQDHGEASESEYAGNRLESAESSDSGDNFCIATRLRCDGR